MSSLEYEISLLAKMVEINTDSVSKEGYGRCASLIVEEAERCGMPYVTIRWLGGLLTNWSTIHLRIQELERLEQLRDSGEIIRLTK